MKTSKVLVAIVLLASTSLSAMAQFKENARAGHFTTEIQFNPFSDDFKTFKMGELKARYFYKENDAFRASLAFGIDNQTVNNDDDFNNKFEANTKTYRISQTSTETTTNKSSLKLTLGYEHHLNVVDRLSVYVGGEIGYEMKFYSGEKKVSEISDEYYVYEHSYSDYKYTENTEKHVTSSEVTKYTDRTPDTSDFNRNNLLLNVFTGLDFDVYKGLYIGTEFGLSFKTGKTDRGYYTLSKESTTINSTRYSGRYPSDLRSENTTTTETVAFDSRTGIRETKTTDTGSYGKNDPVRSAQSVTDYSSTSTSLQLYIQPALRLGWRF